MQGPDPGLPQSNPTADKDSAMNDGTYRVTENIRRANPDLPKGHEFIVAARGEVVTAARAKELKLPEDALEPVGISATDVPANQGVVFADGTRSGVIGAPDGPPDKSEVKDVHVAFAEQLGLDVDGLTKDDVIDAYTAHLDSDDSGDEGDGGGDSDS